MGFVPRSASIKIAVLSDDVVLVSEEVHDCSVVGEDADVASLKSAGLGGGVLISFGEMISMGRKVESATSTNNTNIPYCIFNIGVHKYFNTMIGSIEEAG